MFILCYIQKNVIFFVYQVNTQKTIYFYTEMQIKFLHRNTMMFIMSVISLTYPSVYPFLCFVMFRGNYYH